MRVDDLAALGDLHIAAPGQLCGDLPGGVHQVAPVRAADRAGGVGRACAAARTPVVGQRPDTGFQAAAHRPLTQCDASGRGAGATVVERALQLGTQSVAHLHQ